MKWPLLLIARWLAIFPWIAVFPQIMWAEDTGGPPATAPAPDLSPDPILRPSLLCQNPAAHFYLVLGRLQLDPVRYRKGSQTLLDAAASSAPAASKIVSPHSQLATPTTQTLHVNSVRGNPTVQYSLTSGLTRITINAESAGLWRIESHQVSQGATTRVIVEQTPGEAIVMTCPSAAGEQQIRAATWLHLREANRTIYDQHLEPIINELLWPYQFDELADRAHVQALQEPMATPVDSATIKAWIEDLRSPSRTTRLSADRNLRSVGISLLPKLAQIDPATLDAEQRWRLAEIQTRLMPLAEDDAARLATLIRDDPTYWQLAARRMDDSDLRIVDARFKRLEGGMPVLGPEYSPRVATGESSRLR